MCIPFFLAMSGATAPGLLRIVDINFARIMPKVQGGLPEPIVE